MLEHRGDPTKAVTQYPFANILYERRRWTCTEIAAVILLIIWILGIVVGGF